MASAILRPLNKVRPLLSSGHGHEAKYVGSEMSLSLDAAPNTLAINSTGELVAVGGRKIFLICHLNRDQGLLTVDKSLRDLPPKRTVNLNYSTLDIKWRPSNVEQLVSASPNGSVVLWNLAKEGKNKIDFVFSNHERTVNALCFNHRDDVHLLSGSQDMTMRLFDLRCRQECLRFNGPDAVRDVKFFPPGKDSLFTAMFDNGVVQFWDTRNPDSCLHSMAAHSGPVYSCEWSPDAEGLLVTGGRDKNIKVFDVTAGSSVKSTLKFVISTILPVSRVHWRPGYRMNIASCHQILDNKVSVWSTSRPSIPEVLFPTHTDLVTDFLWLNDKEILSCSKDNRLLVQTVTSATHPVDHVSPIGLSVGCHDNIAFSSRASLFRSVSNSRNPSSFKRKQEEHLSCVLLFGGRAGQSRSPFVECALRFALTGQPPEQLCQHNAQVCRSLGLEGKATTWLILAVLSATPPAPPPPEPTLDPQLLGSRLRHLSGRSGPEAPPPSFPARAGRLSAEVTDHDTGRDLNGAEEDFMSMESFKNDMEFFDEQNEEDLSDIAIAAKLQGSTQEWELPTEDAHLLKQTRDIAERPFSPGRESSMSGLHNEPLPPKPLPSLRVHHEDMPSWSSWQQVLAVIKHYASEGDVQMAVSMLVVMGTQAKLLVDSVQESVAEQLAKPGGWLTQTQLLQWLASYLEQLARHLLWSAATQVRKSWPLADSLDALPTHVSGSSPFLLSCGSCKRGLARPRTYCSACHHSANLCSYCNKPVKGMFLYCWKCCHGGHFTHMTSWFRTHSVCPTGCGCSCSLAGQ